MISTHILDTMHGRPAAGVEVALAMRDGEAWHTLSHHVSDVDGRVHELLPSGTVLMAGVYRLTFHTAAQFLDGLYPEVSVTFTVRDVLRHYHIPLLLSPYGYTTYQGS
jgi:5-hydroxyisourate hydrolase